MHTSRVALIGLGFMGRIYRSRLSAQPDFTVVGVDPDPTVAAEYRTIEGLLRDTTPGLWVVSSPTSTHLAAVRQIVRSDPAARILVEKPAGGLPDLLALVTELRDGAPRAQVVLSDLYGSGSFHDAVRRAVTALGERPTEIAIELSKDRRPDELGGRFVCSDYGPYGYEWFHILRILTALVPQSGFLPVLERPPTTERYDGTRWTWELPGIAVTAASHVDGTIGLPDLVDGACRCRPPVPGRSRRLLVRTPSGAALHVNLDDGRTSHVALTTVHRDGPRTRCGEVDRTDAVVEAVRALRTRTGPPDPWTSLAVPTHIMLSRLSRASSLHDRNLSLEYA